MKYKYILESVRHFCIKRGLNELGYIRKPKRQRKQCKKSIEIRTQKWVITMFKYQIASLLNMQKICTSNTAGIREENIRFLLLTLKERERETQCMLGEWCHRTLSAGVYRVQCSNTTQLYKYSVASGDKYNLKTEGRALY